MVSVICLDLLIEIPMIFIVMNHGMALRCKPGISSETPAADRCRPVRLDRIRRHISNFLMIYRQIAYFLWCF